MTHWVLLGLAVWLTPAVIFAIRMFPLMIEERRNK